MDHKLIRSISRSEGGKIVYLIIDGIGGLPGEAGQTALEAAETPNLDRLAAEGMSGLHEPVGPGITPGSGPGHLALFGYDPIEYDVGRGVLTALGIDFDLREGDVAARGNFCTLDKDGVVTDRRAGRIETERCRELCEKLSGIEVDGPEFLVIPVKEHRFLLVLRGGELNGAITDTDPHETGVKPLAAEPNREAGIKSAGIINRFISVAHRRLQEENDGNGILLRGFDSLPKIPKLSEVTNMRCKAIAAYPMYRGVSRLVGMDVIEAGGELADKSAALGKVWEDGDFFFVHIKKTDSHGEDGDFEAKRKLIEAVDAWLPELEAHAPEVLVVTGDHSTPARLSCHSWHPVPILLHAPKTMRPDGVERFGERAALQGALGPRFFAADILPLAMAHAERLEKFGA